MFVCFMLSYDSNFIKPNIASDKSIVGRLVNTKAGVGVPTYA